MTPPTTLVKAIKNYDPSMRVRWAKATQRWSIECRMPARHPEFLRMVKPPVLVESTVSKIAFDRYEAMQECYFPVLTVPREQADATDAILAGIREHDAAAQGGMAKINAALDAAQTLWEDEQAKAQRTYVMDRAAEADNAVQWAGGHRIATPMTVEEHATSDTVEQFEGFRVSTRRGVHRSLA